MTGTEPEPCGCKGLYWGHGGTEHEIGLGVRTAAVPVLWWLRSGLVPAGLAAAEHEVVHGADVRGAVGTAQPQAPQRGEELGAGAAEGWAGAVDGLQEHLAPQTGQSPPWHGPTATPAPR